MTKTRRAFTDEFKREAVSLLASSGRSLTQVASELGVQPSLLRGWRGALSGAVKTPAGPGALAATAAPSTEQTEIRRLQKELERAQTERDILRKTISIFSGPPK